VDRLARVVNAGVTTLLAAPWIGARMRRRMTVVSYVGRRSGRAFSTPVAYRRHGDQVAIPVEIPDAKNWWRNFQDEGGRVTVRLDGVDRGGHAVAPRDGTRRAIVTVTLDPV
jgi:hypothetical protein